MTNFTNIDLRLGEPRSICNITCELFDLSSISLNTRIKDWEYHITGYGPLIKLLEEKHGAPIIITNGANQGLHATIYALKHKEFSKVGFRLPYWNRIPNIIKYAGLNAVPIKNEINFNESLEFDSYLAVAPNNPDGHLPTADVIKNIISNFKEKDIPVIHDAAYYTRSYVPVDHALNNIGDVQIFSVSKAYGLSSLRLGYMVVHNQSFYEPLKEFMEFQTVGASLASQKIFLHILKREMQVPLLKIAFEKNTRDVLQKARNIIKNINPSAIEFPESWERNYGVFAWVKPKIYQLFQQAKISVLEGDLFGMPGYVRINLAAGNELLQEMTNRINKLTVEE